MSDYWSIILTFLVTKFVDHLKPGPKMRTYTMNQIIASGFGIEGQIENLTSICPEFR